MELAERALRLAANLSSYSDVKQKEVPMRTFLSLCLLVCGAISLLALPQSAKDAPANQASPDPPKVIIEGLVRDIACPIQNLEATATNLSMKCLLACARAGSPLVILTKDGELYVPISGQMPDTDQRAKLMPFLGKYVRVSGVVYERKGSKAIVLSQITELKDVHLTIVDQ